MTDILYVLKYDESGRYDDLRMSLRSVEANVNYVGNIYLVGAIPDWVDRNAVRCLPMEDSFKRKHKNILECIMYAVKHSDIGKGNEHGMFMLSADDHWYMRSVSAMWKGGPLKFKNVLVTEKSIREREMNKEKVNNYERSMLETRQLLESFGMSCVNFAMHENTWLSRDVINSDEWRKMAYQAQNLYVYGCEPTCLVGNMIMSRHPQWIERGFVYQADYKARDFDDIDVVKNEVETNERCCISGSDGACDGRLGKWLGGVFAEKCKYEK